MRILNTLGKEYTSKAKTLLEKLGDVDYQTPTQSELVKIIKEYEVAVIGIDVRFEKQVLEKAKKLQVIATATTGLDHIDLTFAKERKISILSLKDETEFLETITSTSELAFGLLLDIYRNISSSFESVKGGAWDRKKYIGNNLNGHVLGIVGLGRLGKMMAHFGKAFGMNVIAVDPYISEDVFNKTGVVKVTFEELCKKSDCISIHVHLNKETEHFIDKDVFTSMKDSAYLINTSRGKIVKEDELISALKNKIIAGYATDVLDGELYFDDKGTLSHPLVQYAKKNENLLISPHLGGMTHESRRDTDIFIAKRVSEMIKKNFPISE